MILDLQKHHTFGDLCERLHDLEAKRGVGGEGDDLCALVAIADGYFFVEAVPDLNQPLRTLAQAIGDFRPWVARLFGPGRAVHDPVLSSQHAEDKAMSAFGDRLYASFEAAVNEAGGDR